MAPPGISMSGREIVSERKSETLLGSRRSFRIRHGLARRSSRGHSPGTRTRADKREDEVIQSAEPSNETTVAKKCSREQKIGKYHRDEEAQELNSRIQTPARHRRGRGVRPEIRATPRGEWQIVVSGMDKRRVLWKFRGTGGTNREAGDKFALPGEPTSRDRSSAGNWNIRYRLCVLMY